MAPSRSKDRQGSPLQITSQQLAKGWADGPESPGGSDWNGWADQIGITGRMRPECAIWTADDLARAETALTELVASYRDTAPRLAAWLEENVPEGLAVFTLPEHHRKRMRTSNPMERAVQQALKRRTVKVRVFPGEDALLRLVSAVLVEIDEKWASDAKAYIKWECQDA